MPFCHTGRRHSCPARRICWRICDEPVSSRFLLLLRAGSGQHVGYLAKRFPNIHFVPSEFSAEVGPGRAAGYGVVPNADLVGMHLADDADTSLERVFNSIANYSHGLPNVEPPVIIDAAAAAWPAVEGRRFAAMLAFNLHHVTALEVTEGVLAGAGRLLRPGGRLFLYGAFSIDGRHTTESNAEFDAKLRGKNPAWGVRDATRIGELGEAHNLELETTLEMPSNNFLVVLTRVPTEQDCARRRLLQATSAGSEAEWLSAWRERADCWLESQAIETRAALQTCAQALAHRLRARLYAAVQTPPSRPKQDALVVAAAPSSMRGCEWVDALSLPKFPDLTASFDFAVPGALPHQLLPWGLRKWIELGDDAQTAPPSLRTSSAGSQVISHGADVSLLLAGIATAGFSAGAILMCGLRRRK